MASHKKPMRYSDQMYCSHCGNSWDVNDVDPPSCISNHDVFLKVRAELKRVNEYERRSAKLKRGS